MISFIIGIFLLLAGILLAARIINSGIECEDKTTVVLIVFTMLYSYLLIALGLRNILNI